MVASAIAVALPSCRYLLPLIRLRVVLKLNLLLALVISFISNLGRFFAPGISSMFHWPVNGFSFDMSEFFVRF